jgi:hypothetical protein
LHGWLAGRWWRGWRWWRRRRWRWRRQRRRRRGRRRWLTGSPLQRLQNVITPTVVCIGAAGTHPYAQPLVGVGILSAFASAVARSGKRVHARVVDLQVGADAKPWKLLVLHVRAHAAVGLVHNVATDVPRLRERVVRHVRGSVACPGGPTLKITYI